MGLDSFVINPSINVSPYCYSILRIETYATCEHSCAYCFGRWYRGEAKGLGEGALRSLEGLLRLLRKRGLKSMPFRLSTLVDPFQPREEEERRSFRAMKLCLKYEAPLIVNTKSTLIAKGDNLSVLKEMGSRGLTVVQISLSTINPKTASVLEPRAPPPELRLDAAEKLSREGIPVVVRLQPFIPGITDHEVDEVVREAHYAGVKQIVVEALRDEVSNWQLYQSIAYDGSIYQRESLWAPYSPSVETPSRVLRPSLSWRREAYVKVRDICVRFNIEFSTCKEGFYDYHTAKNCCGMHFMDRGKYVLRPTLQEAWEIYLRTGVIPSFDEFARELSEGYIFGEGFKGYPRPIRRKVLQHEKILREVLGTRRGEISLLIPALAANSSRGAATLNPSPHHNVT